MNTRSGSDGDWHAISTYFSAAPSRGTFENGIRNAIEYVDSPESVSFDT